MSVTARIKQKALFKKKMDIADVVSFTGLSYGVCDENYRLNCGEMGEHTLIYDETKLARGLELWLEGNDILLSLSLPTAPAEIRLFYHLVEKLCEACHTKKYLREDVEAYLYETEEYIKWDEEASIVALEEMTSKKADEYRCFEIFGIYNPISIGQKELQRIDCNLNNLEDFLHEIQSLDVYYAAPKVFRKKDSDELFGIYAIGANIDTVVPNKPYIILDQIKGINAWYVMVREGLTIAYDDFINNLSTKEYYDANHVIIYLTENKIADLVEKYMRELN